MPRRLTRTLLAAAMLVLAPLGARAADLVVWWEKGFYPEEDAAVREIVAAFEQKTGKQVELAFHTHDEHRRPRTAAAVEAGQPPDFLFGISIDLLRCGQWAHEDRLVDLADAIGPFANLVRSGRARLRHAARRQDRPTRPLRAADGPHHQPRPRLEEPAGAGRVHPRRHPEGVGGVLVVLVRPGAAGGAQGDRAATTSGASACRCRPRRPTPTVELRQFSAAYEADYVTRDGRLVIDDPAVGRRLIKALDGYTAI